jgi:ornithine carbamoyltransferase
VSVRHLLEIDDLSPAELDTVLRRAEQGPGERPLAGRTVGLYFEKPSLRTRHSCEVAVVQLGGRPVDRLRALGGEPTMTNRPEEAAAGAAAVHTDVWASMGQEDEAEARARAFEGFRVDDRLMAAAAPGAVFMHCLPAHRGEEVSASVADGPRSVVCAQAHNPLHSVRGLLAWLLDRAEGAQGAAGPGDAGDTDGAEVQR